MNSKIHNLQHPATRIVAGIALALGITGCGTVDLKRLTYEMLAQEDCLRNDLDDFCSRGYALEYQEYERARREYLRDMVEQNHD